MVRILRRILCKRSKCFGITVLISFFILITNIIRFVPSGSNVDNIFVYNKNSYVSLPHHSPENEDLPSKQRNRNKPSSYLKLGELEFEPACEIKNKYAISAIHRAKTQSCKQEIVNKTCLIEAGNFYAEKLPNNCVSNKGTLYGRHLGCYVEEKNMKLLSSFNCNHTDMDSHTACLDICVQSGFPYAGVKYTSECFCGDVAPTTKSTDASCFMNCHTDPIINVIGNSSLNVYETGIAKFLPRTPVEIPDYQKSVRIVFILTVSGRALRQIHRLINSLYRSNHYFYIHVDSRQNYLHRKLSALEDQFPNIKLASRRFPTIWGGTSYLQMILASIKYILKFGWQWDFVINLSESNFPIKSLEKLEIFLSANKGLNFIALTRTETQQFIAKQGLAKTFIECEEHMWRVGERKLPRGIVIHGGSDWVCLSSEFATYIVGEQDELLTGLDIFYKHTLVSSESFFHTVLRNSHFCNTIINNNLHLINWKGKLGCKREHPVDWRGCSPIVYRTKDWPIIRNTKDHLLFFARKYEPVICQQIITRSEELIGYNDHYLIPNLKAYWQNIYDTKDFTASTDDTLLTHARSIARYNAKILLEEDCHLEPVEIIEMNLYNYADIYEGNLIIYKAFIHDGIEVLIETWYRPKMHYELHFENQYLDNIMIFKVSSDYDPNESVFRNVGNILGPFSKPLLLYQFSPPIGKNFENLTVIWLDPAGVTADIVAIHVDENNLSNIVLPNLKSPLLTGVWKVSLFELSNQIVTTTFLITPLEYYSGNEVSVQDAGTVLMIDNLSIEFYNILGSCITSKLDLKDKITCGKHKFEYCALSEWSSLSPDPKGTIGKLNKTTGRLDRI